MRINQLLIEQEGVLLDLYRGMDWDTYNPEPGEKATIQIRQDRRPRDSSGALSAIFDLGIERKFNIQNVRRKALFSSTSPGGALYYASSLLDSGRNGVVAQVEVSPTASILFNPHIQDSTLLFHDVANEWIGIAEQLSNGEVSITQLVKDMKDSYLTMLPEQVFRHFAQQCNIQSDDMDAFMKAVYADADKIASGYQMLQAGSFRAPNENTECMIVGVAEFVAHIIEMDESYWD